MKKLLLIALVLGLCLALASCGILPESVTSLFGADSDDDATDNTDDTTGDITDDSFELDVFDPDDLGNIGNTDPDHEHTFVLTSVDEPTCTKKGYINYECECGATMKSANANALGHDEQYNAGKTPTCTEEGWSSYLTCSRCDYTTRGENKPATGHSHDSVFDALYVNEDGYYIEAYCYTCKADVIVTIDEVNDFTLTKHNRDMFTISAVEAIIPAVFYSDGAWYRISAIGDEAFKGVTVMEKVIIPDTVTSITDSAFEGCTGLKEIPLPEGLVTIGENAFKGCSSVNKMLVIPDTVTEIAASAFEGCSKLSTMKGGKSLVTIGENAFKDTRLSMFYYTGSKEEFKAVTVNDAKLKSTQTWYYSEEKASGCWHYVNGSVQPWM